MLFHARTEFVEIVIEAGAMTPRRQYVSVSWTEKILVEEMVNDVSRKNGTDSAVPDPQKIPVNRTNDEPPVSVNDAKNIPTRYWLAVMVEVDDVDATPPNVWLYVESSNDGLKNVTTDFCGRAPLNAIEPPVLTTRFWSTRLMALSTDALAPPLM
jgi:hypothetical protein